MRILLNYDFQDPRAEGDFRDHDAYFPWCEVKWKSLSSVQLCNYTVHGILQARILEWVDFSLSRGFSQPRPPTLQADSLPAEPQGKPKNSGVGSPSLLQQVFPTQESSQGLLQYRWVLSQLSHRETPRDTR